MAERILIYFPEMERVAEQFQAHADVLEQTHRYMNRSAESLYRSGLQGQFVDELDNQLTLLRNWLWTCAEEVFETGQDLATVVAKARQTDAECAVLFRTYGAAGSATASRIEQGWDGGYNGCLPDQADVIFINGIWTTHGEHLANLDKLAGLPHLQGKNVMGIYNQTDGDDGTAYDVLQALEDAFQTGDYDRLIANPAIDSLVRAIEQNPGRAYELTAHSQGAAITAAALCVLASRGVDLSHLTVNTFGGAGMVYPKGPAYNHYTFAGDPITLLRSAGSALFGSELAARAPFETDPIVDDLRIVPGHIVEHSFDAYQENYTRATPSLSSFVKETELSFQAEHSAQVWKQTTSLGNWGKLDASLMDVGHQAEGSVEWDWDRFTASGGVDAHAYLGSFDLTADVAGFDIAASGYVGAEASVQGELVLDPYSGDIAVRAEAGAFAGAKTTGEINRDFGAMDAEGRAGFSYGIGATLDADFGFEGGMFQFEFDSNVAAGLGFNAGASVELDVNEAMTTVTSGLTELSGRLLLL